MEDSGRGFGHEVKKMRGHGEKEAKQGLSFRVRRAPELITNRNGNDKLSKVLQYLIPSTHTQNELDVLELILSGLLSAPLFTAFVEAWIYVYPVWMRPSETCWKNEQKCNVDI